MSRAQTDMATKFCPTSPTERHRIRVEEPHDGVKFLPGVCKYCGYGRDYRAGSNEGAGTFNGRALNQKSAVNTKSKQDRKKAA